MAHNAKPRALIDSPATRGDQTPSWNARFDTLLHLTFILVTGLIYVAIVALWAAVLIPMWLRRHDAGEAHRLERHQEAMGILARFRNGGTIEGTPARRAARRRRAIVATLVAVTVTGAVAWVLQVAGAWAVILPGSALLVFVGSAAWATRTASRPALERSARRSVSVRQDEELHEQMSVDTAYEQEQDRESERVQERMRQREERRAQRRDRVAAAERAEQDGYSYRQAGTHRTEVIATPPSRTSRDRVALEGTAIDQTEADDVSAQARPAGRRRAAWDQVFDQTA